MANILDDGTVIPHGLLSANNSDFTRAFEKSYKNTALRLGIITNIYPISDSKNVTRLSTEYDVIVIEQDANRGITPVTYKNCLSIDSLGSLADYFEKNYRSQTQTDNQFVPNTKGQNGAIVLVLCLDSTTGKGVILGGQNHPDRPTNLKTSEPQLYGEYNGVQIKINPDGSTSLTFNGATDNNGDVIDTSQGTTIFQIEKDGTYEFTNTSVSIQGNKSGILNITCTGAANIKATGDTNINTQAACNITAQGNASINTQASANITSSGKTSITASEIDLNGSSGKVLTTVTDPVVDTIYGAPTQGVNTVKAG